MLRLAFALVLATLFLGKATSAAAEDAAAGEKVFMRCSICHSVTPGAGSTIGPRLNGVIGRKAGAAPGYQYSKAMAGSGLTWTKSNLDQYLTNPQKLVPGNKMAFAGLPNANDRANLIAYLATRK